ncbi:MAG: biotin/lipoyl-containing protein, partial [Ornithinimicrobium sp.]|uniref:biotin/lipoyl-containing protein n=1 Tax=Ornithinimicrobium sp. TaxID=1977084 RepID=UPI0026DED430
MPEFKLPDPGEGLVEATITAWKVAVGDSVKTNDIVVEVETAKSLVELPIPWDGTVTQILHAEGDEVEVGTPIIVIDTGDGAGRDGSAGEAADAADAAPSAPVPADAVAGAEPKREAVLVGYGAIETATTRRRRRGEGATEESAAPRRAKASPPVRKYAKERGVDLTQVQATRDEGVVTRADVDAHLAGGAAGAAPAATAPAATSAAAAPTPTAPT